MTDETAGAAGEEGAAEAPRFEIGHQYIKDLSFEVPNAPHVFETKAPPEVTVNVDVGVRQVAEATYEVTLKTEAHGESNGTPLFIVELVYAGLIQVSGAPPEHLQPILMIEGPRMLFPFARNIIASLTRDGGLPPLMISPIDFVALYRDRLAAAQAQAEAQATNGPEN
jgi:preprotein translocase subunit SecB